MSALPELENWCEAHESTPTPSAPCSCCCRVQAEPADDSFSSSYPGVRWNKGRKKWEAYIKINGKQKYLGLFADEHEAALAWAAAKWEQEDATRTMEGWTELLVDGQAAQLKRLMALHPKRTGAAACIAATKKKGSYRGVGWHKPKGRWEVRFYSKRTKKQKALGRYVDELEAALVWAAAAWAATEPRKGKTQAAWIKKGRAAQIKILNQLQKTY